MSDNTIAFKQDGIDLVIDGKKTVALYPMMPQPEEFFLRVGDDEVVFYAKKGKNQLYTATQIEGYGPFGQVDDVVSPRGRDDIKLQITAVCFDMVSNLPAETWKRVGLSDLSEVSIYTYWDSFFGNTEYRWENNPWVWVVEFILVTKEAK